MTDNVAVMAGFTREVFIIGGAEEVHALVRPDQDFDERFKAWDCDQQEYVWVNGWMCGFEG